MNTYERFMAKVNVHGGNNCWNWAGSKSGSGYGQFWDGARNIPAHWFLLDKRPSKGQEACHHCDNKLCVRPSHIFIGTRSDNMQDCVAKGRNNRESSVRNCKVMLSKRHVHRGVNNHESKLTEAQAMEAKACSRKYGEATKLAKKFGVSLTVICDIRDGKRWTHLC